MTAAHPRRAPEWMFVGHDEVTEVHRGARRHALTALVTAALVVAAVAATYPTLRPDPFRGFVVTCPVATVLGLFYAFLTLRAVRRRAAVGEHLDRRLGRTFTKALAAFAIISWVVGAGGTLLLHPDPEPPALPPAATVLASIVLSYQALACDRWFRPRSTPPGPPRGS